MINIDQTRRNFYFTRAVAVLCCCIVFLLFVSAGQVKATIFYVSNCGTVGNDSNDGTLTSAPWLTVNKVNTSTFNPGDSILFNRGCEWREALTVPSSGTANNLLTFGAYGTGANPILNGSTQKLNTDFSLYAFPRQSLFSATLINAQDSTGAAIRNYRQVFIASANSNTIQISLQASAGGDWAIGGTSIGLQSVNDTTVGTPTRITWDDGQNITNITAGATATSDVINFPVVSGQRYLVHVYMTTRHIEYAGSGSGMWSSSATVDETLTVAPGGSGAAVFFLGSVTGDDKTIYSAVQAEDPVDVLEDNVFLAEKASLAAVTGNGQWYWDDSSDTLYVAASDGSSVIENGKLYEVYGVDYNIWDNGKNYVDISNIDCKAALNNKSTMGGIFLTGSNNKVHDLSAYSGRRHLFSFYTGADNCEAYNLNIHDSVDTYEVAIYNNSTANNILRNSNIYKSSNQPNLYPAGLLITHGGAYGNTVKNCHIYSNSSLYKRLIEIYDNNTSITFDGNYFSSAGNDANWSVLDAGYQTGDVGATSLGVIIFKNNIIEAKNNIGGNIIYFRNANNAVIVNNTIIGPTTSTKAAIEFSGSTGATVENNIIYSPYIINVPVNSQSGITIDYNDEYYSSTRWTWGLTDYTSLADWRSGSGQSANSISSDPVFASSTDYTLQSTSPVIDAGTNLGDLYKNAISPSTSWSSSPIVVSTADQNFRGSRWEIGAYVYPVPRAPTVGTPSVQSATILRWNFEDNADDETGFKIYDGADVLIASLATENLEFFDETELSANTEYSGRYLKAYNSYGESSASSAFPDVYTLANDPASLVFARSGDGAILSASAFLNDQDGQSGYFFSRTGGGNSGWIKNNTWEDSGLGCGLYNYAVKYRNADAIETETLSAEYRMGSCVADGEITEKPTDAETLIVEVKKQTLQAEIARLMKLIAELSGKPTPPTTSTPTSFQFTKVLQLGDTDPQVKQLQQFLNAKGFTVSQTGPGSSGNETSMFGHATRNALIKFQEAYAEQILKPLGLTNGTGKFAKMTITVVNGLGR